MFENFRFSQLIIFWISFLSRLYNNNTRHRHKPIRGIFRMSLSSVPAETPDGQPSDTDMAIFLALSNKAVTDTSKATKANLLQFMADKEAAGQKLAQIQEEEVDLGHNNKWMANLATNTPHISNEPQPGAVTSRQLSPSQIQQQKDFMRQHQQQSSTMQSPPRPTSATLATSAKNRIPSLFEQQVMSQLAAVAQSHSPQVKVGNQWQMTGMSPGHQPSMTLGIISKSPVQHLPPSSPYVPTISMFEAATAAAAANASGTGSGGQFGSPRGPAYNVAGDYSLPKEPPYSPQQTQYQQQQQQQQQFAQYPGQQPPPESPLGQGIPQQYRYNEDDERIRTEKQIALLELQKLKLQGKVLTRVEGFSMQDPLTEILTEIDGHNSNENMVTMTSNISEFAKMVPYGIVMLNQKVKILKVNEEWADDFTKQENMAKMQGPIEKIYKRFLKRATMNPFLEIAMILIASLVCWDLRCRFKGSGKERRKATVELEPEPDSDIEHGDATDNDINMEMPEPPQEENDKAVPNGGLDMFMKAMGGGQMAR